MRSTPTSVDGVVLIEPRVFTDARGSFTTPYGKRAVAALGIAFDVAETHIARNTRTHTLRGMHFQAGVNAQAKLVRCIRGAIYDVALDLRPESPTYLRWMAVELRNGDGRTLYIPTGCAHGYLTLEDDADVLYHVDAPYDPDNAGGVRWNDPAFGIDWPAAPRVIAGRDATYPDYRRAR